MDSYKAEFPHYDYKSVHTECRRHEDEHKWIASQRAGYDLGEEAIRQWVTHHWRGYLLARWVEHLQGKHFWIELDRCYYGVLQREFPNQEQLLDDILERLKNGDENLRILCWAIDQGYDCEKVDRIINILAALDVNSARILHRSEETKRKTAAEEVPEPFMAASA